MAKSHETMSTEELRKRLLDVLEKHGKTQGLISTALGDKCGDTWKKSLAKLVKCSASKAGPNYVRNFVYQMWIEGLVFLEPPRDGQRVPRIWDMNAARAKFPTVCSSATGDDVVQRGNETEDLRAAYERHFGDHAGGFVPIFKVRRSLGWTRSRFDTFLKELNERQDPVVELHEGDPHDYTEDQQADSVQRGGRTYFRMRWRKR